MKEVVSIKKELTIEERSYLSVAYKNAIGSRRSAWRVLKSIHPRPDLQEEKQKEKANLILESRRTIEKEITGICEDVIDILALLLKKDDEMEASDKVFYRKMTGDYYRYMAEVKPTEDVISNASKAYEGAIESSKDLVSTNPVRLGLALNCSVFYYEVLRKPTEACKLARDAFNSALGKLGSLNSEDYRNSATIMQLLKDNLKLWTGGVADVEGQTEEGEEHEDESVPAEEVTA